MNDMEELGQKANMQLPHDWDSHIQDAHFHEAHDSTEKRDFKVRDSSSEQYRTIPGDFKVRDSSSERSRHGNVFEGGALPSLPSTWQPPDY